ADAYDPTRAGDPATSLCSAQRAIEVGRGPTEFALQALHVLTIIGQELGQQGAHALRTRHRLPVQVDESLCGKRWWAEPTPITSANEAGQHAVLDLVALPLPTAPQISRHCCKHGGYDLRQRAGAIRQRVEDGLIHKRVELRIIEVPGELLHVAL